MSQFDFNAIILNSNTFLLFVLFCGIFFWRLLHIGHRRAHSLQQQTFFLRFLCIVARTVANSIFPNESVDFCAKHTGFLLTNIQIITKTIQTFTEQSITKQNKNKKIIQKTDVKSEYRDVTCINI